MQARLNANMQGIFTRIQALTQFYLKTGPHADTHTKRKETPESLFDPRSCEERQAGGQSSDGYLAIGERGYSVLWHLPMVVGLVPVPRGGLVVRGGARVVNSRGPRREVGVALPFLVEAQQMRLPPR